MCEGIGEGHIRPHQLKSLTFKMNSNKQLKNVYEYKF